MPACAFFGHRNAPDEIKPFLADAVEKLISVYGVDTFYIGNHGKFDSCARSVLRFLSESYPDIKYYIVLAYFPDENGVEFSDTIIPDGLEFVPPRFGISHRNEWMIKKSDFIIGYINYSFGGASKYFELAKKRGKTVINLAEQFHCTI